MDYELDPGCLPVQNHMENLKVFEDSWFFDWIILRHEFSGMHGKNRPDSGTLYDQVSNTPGRSRVENRVAWEEPDWMAHGVPSEEVTDAQKHEHPDTIVMDSALCPGSVAWQNHV